MRRSTVMATRVAGMLAAASLSALAEPTATLRVRYQAPADCPSQAQFLERTRARLGALESSDDPSAPLARIAVKRLPAGRWVGELGWEAAPVRRFEADGCEQVVDALALAIAIAPESALGAPEPEEPQVLPEPEAPPPEQPPRVAAREPSRPAPAEATSVRDSGPLAGAADGARSTTDVAWAGILQAGGVIGMAPDAAVFGGLALELHTIVDLRVAARVAHAAVDRGIDGLTLIAGSIEGSPIRLETADRAAGLAPYAGLCGGLQLASGPGALESAPWFSLLFMARGRLRTGPSAFIELGAGAEVPLVIHRFFVARENRPQTQDLVHSTSEVIGIIELSAGLWF